MSTVQILILLTIGYVAMTIDKKQKNFPLPVFLVGIGFGLSFIPYFNSITISKEIIYTIFLPGLLFASAYHYSAASLRKHAKVIGTLSTAGLLVTALLLGLATYWMGAGIEISLVGALLVASILTPTDPVSVVSILKKSLDDPSVADIVDGESMINDGTSVVLFTVLLTMFTTQQEFEFWPFIGEFLSVSIGGVATGLVAGWIVSKAIHLSTHRENQVLLSVIIAYGAFHLAEAFGFSGVLATVAAGIMLSAELGRADEEEMHREYLNGFWKVAEPALLSILFLAIGIVAADYLLPLHHGWLAIGIFIVSIISRFIVIAGTMQLFSGYRKLMNVKKASLLSWAGIRGTMSIFLLLSLADAADSSADALVSLGFAVVLLSLVVQSIGIYPLSKALEK
ncbi:MULTISPECIES: sodium:proton antiporter [unclassified Sporosarcina]|uniref:cation:proton antiporter n=1 Tax=unclassified Sporosarcina TaxID=2647733 RepID=UPI000C16A048|nr:MULTISPECIES: sodium:proton antiporter [unclassified Sporosarcina]PID04378.1 sodium:proton antiporter [Sporosarcina sp. P30]PID07556.1 sodium:proton antiporter [Sporosarcina sp. P31]PID10763.1 sodium:proton antiporter [Sporosarcina sp. P32b]